MRWLVIIWAIFGILMSLTAQDVGNFTLTSVEQASTYGDPAQMALSPDGNLLAWTHEREGICIYNFMTIEEEACTPFPTQYFDTHTALRWSPDSTSIALTENWLVNFIDSDVWLFEVATGVFINRTNDEVNGSVMGVEPEAYTIDVLPIWNPVTGDLYFFRYVRNGSPFTLSLYRIPNTSETFAGVIGGDGDVLTNTPELITILDETTFTGLSVYNGFTFAFDGGATISPDGTQLAFLSRSASRDNFIGIIDLETGSFGTNIPFSGLDGIGVPDWYNRENRFVLNGITWADSGTKLLISTRNASTLGGVIETMLYQLDMATDEVTALFDLSNIPDEQTYLTSDAHESPRTALILPDSHLILYYNFNRSAEQSNLSVYDLSTMNQNEVASIPLDDFVYTEMTQASVGQSEDTLRVLMYGYLFTFTRNT